MQKMNVLIVDDEPGIRKLIGQIIDDRCEVRMAGTVKDAMRMMTEMKPDIVISDVKMPGEDGMSLLQHICDMDRQIPTILITGHADQSMRNEAMQIGAFHFLEKPFEDEDLLMALTKASNHRQNCRLGVICRCKSE